MQEQLPRRSAYCWYSTSCIHAQPCRPAGNDFEPLKLTVQNKAAVTIHPLAVGCAVRAFCGAWITCLSVDGARHALRFQGQGSE